MALDFKKLKNTIPQTPGVYFFHDKQGAILYIGKAANLRARVSSYFLKSAALEAAKRQMVRDAVTVTWWEASSEIEALLEEALLIKKHLPHYNVLMRDDKQYLFVVFTKEQYPRIFFTHQPIAFVRTKSEKRKAKNILVKDEYIGPFTEGGAVKRLLRSLRKAFPYCTCKKPHARLCQQVELGLCFGFCCVQNLHASNEERAQYRKNIRYVKNVLAGRQKQLLKRLQTNMNQSARKQQYEHAALLRNQIYMLERIFAHQHTLKKDYRAENQKGLHELMMLLGLKTYPQRIEGYDISNIQGNYAVGSMVVFVDGSADKNAYRKFRIRTVEGANDTAMMREVLTRRIAHLDWSLPDIMLIDGGKPQLNAALKALHTSNLATRPPSIITIAKREEELYVPGRKIPFKLKEMPVALLYLLQQIRDEAHRFAISYYRKRHRKESK